MTCYTNPFKKRLFRAEDRIKEIDEKLLEYEDKIDKLHSLRESAIEPPTQPTGHFSTVNQNINESMVSHIPASVSKSFVYNKRDKPKKKKNIFNMARKNSPELFLKKITPTEAILNRIKKRKMYENDEYE